MCRIASLFMLQRLKGSMSGDARDFNNIETQAVINFFFPARQGTERRISTPSYLATLYRVYELSKVCNTTKIETG